MKKLFCLPLLAVLLFGGCRKNETVGCGAEAPEGYKVFITPATTPSIGIAPGEPVLSCQDNQSHPCYNYKLLAALQRKDNLLRLNFCGIEEPQICATALGPASGGVYLRELPAQVYQLDITVRNRRTTGTLDMTTTPARLTIADTTVAAVR